MEIDRAEIDWLVKNADPKVKQAEEEPRLKGKPKFRLILLSQQETERYRRWLARFARISGQN